jgi:hypothetical protein
MKNLKRFQGIAIAVALLSLLFVIGLIASIATIKVTVITTVCLLTAGIVIIVLAHALNDEHSNQVKVKDYNELRQVIITTKLKSGMYTLNQDKELEYMHCARSGKSRFCHECKHQNVHLWTTECSEVGCETCLRVQ